MRLTTPAPLWRSEPATPAQRAVIRKRQLASDEDLVTMTKGYASELIRASVGSRENPRSGPLTEAQIRLIISLSEALGDDPEDNLKASNKYEANTTITNLRLRMETENALAEGLYMVQGVVYKVRTSSIGKRYANKLVKLTEPEPASNGVRTHRFIHAPGTINRIRPGHALTKEQAIAFGQETSSCVRCGTQLSTTIKTKDGQPRWIGPECEKKMGWR